jgi:hypothetical protein
MQQRKADIQKQDRFNFSSFFICTTLSQSITLSKDVPFCGFDDLQTPD